MAACDLQCAQRFQSHECRLDAAAYAPCSSPLTVENVSEGEPTERSWTQVLGTRGGRGVRADFRCVDASDGHHYVFEQTVEGTPFERFVRIARTEIELDPLNGETEVTMVLERRMRGLSRLGSPMMRRAIGRTLNDALDGLETAATGTEG